MNLTEKRATAKNQLLSALFDALPTATQIGDYETVVPVEIEGETIFVGVTLNTKDTRGTKGSDKRPAREPFQLEVAVADYDALKAERAEIARLSAEIKARRG